MTKADTPPTTPARFCTAVKAASLAVQSPPLTRGQKAAATRRENTAKRAAKIRPPVASTPSPSEPGAKEDYTPADEATILEMIATLQVMLAKCRAAILAEKRQSQHSMRDLPVVSLADW